MSAFLRIACNCTTKYVLFRVINDFNSKNKLLMLDINFIRENIDRVKTAGKAKNRTIDIDYLLLLDDKRKHFQGVIDQLKFDQKKAGQERNIELATSLKSQIATQSEQYEEILSEFNALMLQVPQVIHSEVIIGKDESENVEVRKE